MTAVVRIVGGEHSGNDAQMTHGTKVYLPDGSVLPGVTKIVLIAEVNDVWRAEISCTARVTDLSAEAFIEHKGSWQAVWREIQRLLRDAVNDIRG